MSAVPCGQAETFFGIMSAMKPKILIGAATAVFAVLAGVGVVAGREWRLLLVPLGMLPCLRVLAKVFSVERGAAEDVSESYSSALGDAFHAGFATVFTDVLAVHLGGSGCYWAPCAVTAAVAMASLLPVFSVPVRYPVLRATTLFAAAAWFAVMPFAYTGSLDIARLGTAFTMLFYAPARLILAFRRLRGGRTV